MSEERKPEESLMSDETLFFGYAKAIVGGAQAGPTPGAIKFVIDLTSIMIDEHRKRFPKRITQDSHCDCGSRCVKCWVDKK